MPAISVTGLSGGSSPAAVPTAPAPDRLSIRLFGGFDVQVGDKPLPPLRSRSEQWLLALLALRSDRDTPRDWLAETIWPDAAPARALFYLRRGLSDLRGALGREAQRLKSPSPRTLRLDLAGADCDVARFDAGVASGQRSGLEEAVSLYAGPLLPGCAQEWVPLERARRQQAYILALEQLAAVAATENAGSTRIRLLRLAVAADPLSEATQRRLLAAHAERGDYTAAFEAYRELRILLHREMNAAPHPETVELFEQIRARSRTGVSRSSAAVPDASAAPPASPLTPRSLTRLIGRNKDLREIEKQVTETRLVTLTGIGGVGKTRLAVEAIANLEPLFSGDVCFLDLSGLSDPDQVVGAVSAALNVRAEPGKSPIETLTAALRYRRALLSLDNCEHLAEECARLTAALLGSCPSLHLLATSRQPLGLLGEVVWWVPGLEVPEARPDPGEKVDDSADHSEPCASVELFVERARANDRRFSATPANLSQIEEICRRLEGIPLALELAAAITRSVPLPEIVRRLDDRYRLLTRGSSSVPRHRTLRAAVDWSYSLLSDPERALLRRLSVFAGGWTLSAAEAVCGVIDERAPKTGSPPHRLDEPTEAYDDTATLLGNLVDRSLVQFLPESCEERAPARYRLLETLREYAREKLEESGEAPAVLLLHRDHFLRVSEELEERQNRAERLDGLDALIADLDNFRAALSWSLEQDPAAGLRLALNLNPLWKWRSQLGEGCGWVERLLAQCSAPGMLAEAAYDKLGTWNEWMGNLDAAAGWYRQALSLARASGNEVQEAFALSGLGTIAFQLGDYPTAVSFLQASAPLYLKARQESEALRIRILLAGVFHQSGNSDQAQNLLEECLLRARQIGAHRNAAAALDGLGDLAGDRGDLNSAHAYYSVKLATAQASGFHELVVHAWSDLGRVAWRRNDPENAIANVEAGLRVARELGSPILQTFCLNHLARMAFAARDLNRLGALGRESLELAWRAQETGRIVPALHRLAGLAALLGEPIQAVRLLATASRLEETRGRVTLLNESEMKAEIREMVVAHLDEAAFHVAWADASALGVNEGVTEALRWVRTLPSPSRR